MADLIIVIRKYMTNFILHPNHYGKKKGKLMPLSEMYFRYTEKKTVMALIPTLWEYIQPMWLHSICTYAAR